WSAPTSAATTPCIPMPRTSTRPGARPKASPPARAAELQLHELQRAPQGALLVYLTTPPSAPTPHPAFGHLLPQGEKARWDDPTSSPASSSATLSPPPSPRPHRLLPLWEKVADRPDEGFYPPHRRQRDDPCTYPAPSHPPPVTPAKAGDPTLNQRRR